MYSKMMGHANVPKECETGNGYGLGSWVAEQRKKRSQMTPERITRLESVPGWIWNAVEERWEEGFRNLLAYLEQRGSANVPGLYRAENGYGLGSWVAEQRKKQGRISPERIARLESLPGWVWDAISERWENGFSYFKDYVEKNGSAKILSQYQTIDGFHLGDWVSEQRKKQATLSLERKARLEALPGWVWDVHTDRWDEGLGYLLEFSNQNGHCIVPQNFKTADGYRLGQWVSERRKKKDDLSQDRKTQLDALPGWVWHKYEENWERTFVLIKEFVGQHGHCKIGPDYNSPDGYNLREWINTQRKEKDRMIPERRTKLEALPGWVWNAFSAQWESNYKCLQEFENREGHCNVPKQYETDDGIRLGLWVSNQRRAKDLMPSERKGRLEALQSWSWSTSKDVENRVLLKNG